MQNTGFIKLGMAALLALTLAACNSTDTEGEMDTGMEDTSTVTTGGAASTSGTGNPGGLSDREMAERNNALNMTIFYFEFDRSDLSAEARAALVHHADYLKSNPTVSYRLEGHADERGTREYNLALGERRAQAIERYLQVQGVPARQLETISYGEENPVAMGSTESAYARNRRVELK